MPALLSQPGSAVNEQFRSLLTPRGGLSRRVLNITMLLWLLEIEIIKRVPFQLPWKTSMKMKCSRKLTEQPRLSAVEMEHGSQGQLQENKLCSGWPPDPTSVFLNSPESQPNLLPYTSRTSEQTEANLTAKIQIKTLVIDISDQQMRFFFPPLQQSNVKTALCSERLKSSHCHTGIAFPVLTWAEELKQFLPSPITCDSPSLGV